MKKLVFLVFMCFILLAGIGCSRDNHVGTTRSGTIEYDLICIDGVEYIQYAPTISYKAFMSPHMKPDGTCYTCK